MHDRRWRWWWLGAAPITLVTVGMVVVMAVRREGDPHERAAAASASNEASFRDALTRDELEPMTLTFVEVPQVARVIREQGNLVTLEIHGKEVTVLDLGSYRMHQPEARAEYVHQGPAIWKLRREPEVTQTESYDIDAECGPGGSGAYDPSIGGAWRVPDGYRYGGERAVVYEIHVVRFTRPPVCLPPV